MRHTPETFWAKVAKTEKCWMWLGGVTRLGYGFVGYQGKRWSAHRLAYTLAKGAIPAGLELDHLCRNPSCVNPDHLEPVTQYENMRRSVIWEPLTHCRRGHEMTLENTYFRPDRPGKRECRVCRDITDRRNYLNVKRAKRMAEYWKGRESERA